MHSYLQRSRRVLYAGVLAYRLPEQPRMRTAGSLPPVIRCHRSRKRPSCSPCARQLSPSDGVPMVSTIVPAFRLPGRHRRRRISRPPPRGRSLLHPAGPGVHGGHRVQRVCVWTLFATSGTSACRRASGRCGDRALGIFNPPLQAQDCPRNRVNFRGFLPPQALPHWNKPVPILE